MLYSVNDEEVSFFIKTRHFIKNVKENLLTENIENEIINEICINRNDLYKLSKRNTNYQNNNEFSTKLLAKM